MRIQKKEKQLKEVDIITEDYSECDKCGEKIRTNCYDAFDCEITIQTGDVYPESRDILERTVDLCKKCSEDLFVLLENNGYRINERQID